MGLLELKDLTREYTRGGRAFNAVDCVNLSVESGDFVSIIGRSGSGKSTLLNMSAGLITPSRGNVFFDGIDIHRLNDRDVSLFRNGQIGYVPQGQCLLSYLTVLENVCIPLFLFKRAGEPAEQLKIRRRAIELLEKTGISHLAASYPRELSGGEMRRVAIARSLINNPSLVIADEPTSDLDAETTTEIMQMLSAIARERTASASQTAVLIVTHEIDAHNFGNKTYVMNDGKLTIKPN
uniref:ABC transporter ATP-binding protein n=1 Tax=uncultured bacterium contig00036 TaxID=1181524 RepID=A0A806KEM5_9BACT|nr:ABC transporter ATP-binding protein [uncultured bacterium contig00036]